MTPALLRNARVPADCEMPAQRLSNNQTSPRYKPKSGGFLLEGSDATLTADLDGDGNQDLLAVYGCNAGNVAWPELLIAYGPGGRMLGYADLGTYDKREHAVVQHWAVSGGSVHVQWISYDGAGFGTTHHDSGLRLTGNRLQVVPASPTSAAVTDITGQSDGYADFTSPTGNIACTLDKSGARCDISEHTWHAPAAKCSLHYGSTLILTSTTVFGCVGDAAWDPVDAAEVPRWFAPGLDPIIRFHGERYRALGYGHTLRAGNLSCASTKQGVTCTNRSTGHGFTLSREKAQVH